MGHPCFSSNVEFNIVAEGPAAGEDVASVASVQKKRRVTGKFMVLRMKSRKGDL